MFIKLTNASESYNGQPLVIRKNTIISVYSMLVNDPSDSDNASVVSKTYIFSEACSWEVQETVHRVYDLLMK